MQLPTFMEDWKSEDVYHAIIDGSINLDVFQEWVKGEYLSALVDGKNGDCRY